MSSTVAAADGFLDYFTEKLWAMIPAVYRHEDGIAAEPGVLRALVEVLAEQAVVLRHSQDRLWEDQFIDTCDDWAIPYIGRLVGTRLVSALNPAGQRVDVAKTIYYRRRKGTVPVLEELIGDIARIEGTVVEPFRRLARARHGLDPPPRPGRQTGTMPGGWADLRWVGGAELAGGPFEDLSHLPDVRRHRGGDGRYGIPKLAFHLYRLRSYRIEHADPWAHTDGEAFTFDPSGRDVALFARRSRSDDWATWHSAREWELPLPIRCRLLADAQYQITETAVLHLEQTQGLSSTDADELRRLIGLRMRGAAEARRLVDAYAPGALAVWKPLLAATLVDDCGKQHLSPAVVSVDEAGATVPVEETTAGNLGTWLTAATDARLVVDPERGRLRFVGGAPLDPVTVSYHVGFSGEVGAGTYDRRRWLRSPPFFASPAGGGPLPAATALNAAGVTSIGDGRTYGPVSNKSAITEMVVQAADGCRPFLKLNNGWNLAGLNTGPTKTSTLTLEGLWIGGGRGVFIRGYYRSVTIGHCTLDPGGVDAVGAAIDPVTLVVVGQIDELIIESSILGPIRVQPNSSVDVLRITDSIVQSINPSILALSQDHGELRADGVTVLGSVAAHRLHASEMLVTGDATVTDTQHGCFRFGAAPPGSRLPRRYESASIQPGTTLFTSRRFGDAGFAQLSEAAPVAIREGGEHGTEMGAFAHLKMPIRLAGLRAKVDEFAPFGLVPMFIPET